MDFNDAAENKAELKGSSQQSDDKDLEVFESSGVTTESSSSDSISGKIEEHSREQKILRKSVRSQSLTISPTLPPEYLKEYEQMCPGAGKRILLSSVDLAEKEQDADIKLRMLRHKSDEELSRARSKRADRAQWMAFTLAITAILGGIVLIALDKQAAGLGAIITPTAAIIAAFIANQVSARKRNSTVADKVKITIEELVSKMTDPAAKEANED